MLKTKAIRTIEERLEGVEEGSLRHQILQSAKSFKTSWIELGQALCSAWKDKSYKEWGFMTFDAYTVKEIGIRKDTALKLIRSYFFLEKEEPVILKKDFSDPKEISKIPGYEAVNVLRMAKNKKTLDNSDYVDLRKNVLELGKDARDVKKDLTCIIKQRQELEPEEAREKKRISSLRRFVSTLRAIKKDAEIGKMLPAGILKETETLIKKIELEIGPDQKD